jgi:hypothetical protein
LSASCVWCCAEGFDNVVRIYDKGTNVKLAVPAHDGGAIFDSWDLIGRQVDEPGVKKREVSAKLDDHVLAQCHWARALTAAETTVDEIEISPKALRDYVKTQRPDSPMRAEFAALLKQSAPAGKRREASAAPPPRDLPIRVEPTMKATVIGIAPALEEAEVLEDGKRWKRVNHRGVVGWVDADDR